MAKSTPFSQMTGFPSEWRVESARQIADTVAGTILDVTHSGGQPAIVKLLKPKVLDDSLRGADFMEWRDGIGCVRLIARSANMLLMEHGGTITLRDRLLSHGDEDATRIAAEVLLAYHQSSEASPPASLQPLSRYFASLLAKAERDRRDGIRGVFIQGGRGWRRN